MPKRYGKEFRRSICERLVAGERVLPLSEETGDAGLKPGIRSVEVDELAQAQRAIEELDAELEAVKAASALVGRSQRRVDPHSNDDAETMMSNSDRSRTLGFIPSYRSEGSWPHREVYLSVPAQSSGGGGLTTRPSPLTSDRGALDQRPVTDLDRSSLTIIIGGPLTVDSTLNSATASSDRETGCRRRPVGGHPPRASGTPTTQRFAKKRTGYADFCRTLAKGSPLPTLRVWRSHLLMR